MKAMEEACKDPNNYKYSLADMPELLEAVQYRYEKRFGVHVEKDEIMSVYGYSGSNGSYRYGIL